jgi:hypothetical protein
MTKIKSIEIADAYINKVIESPMTEAEMEKATDKAAEINQCLGEISRFILGCALQAGSGACLRSRQRQLGSRVAIGARPQ